MTSIGKDNTRCLDLGHFQASQLLVRLFPTAWAANQGPLIVMQVVIFRMTRCPFWKRSLQLCRPLRLVCNMMQRNGLLHLCITLSTVARLVALSHVLLHKQIWRSLIGLRFAQRRYATETTECGI